MATVNTITRFKSKPDKVFSYMDDIRNIGDQMMGMGGTLDLEILSENDRGAGAIYHWTGKILGIRVDFKETVVHWVENREKTYQSISGARFSLHHLFGEMGNGTQVESELFYELPLGGLGKVFDKIFIHRYVVIGLNRVMDRIRQNVDRP